MKALVVYDSLYGNTEQIAKAIAANMGEEAMSIKVTEANAAAIAPYFYIIVGSPTQGGRMTPAIKTFLDSLTPNDLKDKRFATFDTRAKSFIVKLFGWAGPKMQTIIISKNGNPIAPPMGFFVTGTKGPLVEGELERAAAWGKRIATR
jgi:flavodoxin I